jgi:hypothetical protein
VFVIPALGGVELVEDPPAAAILDALRPEVAA